MNRDEIAPASAMAIPIRNTVAQIRSTLTLSALHEDPAKLSQNLNATILQYLESCGLEKSYTTFCKECDDKEVPFPKELPPPSFPRRAFRQKDAQALLKSLDEEDEVELIALWNAFVNDLEPEQGHTVGGITFYLHVFAAAIVPYRQNRSEVEKKEGMDWLKQFFQDKSQTVFVDANMLTLYALPFVPDPMNHTSFKDLFEDSRKADLKSRVERALSRHFEAHGTVPGANSELTQMFISYFQQPDDEDEGKDVGARSEKLVPTPSAVPMPIPVAVVHEDKSTQKSTPDANDAEVQTEENDPKTAQLTEALQNAYGHNHRLNLEIQEVRGKLFRTEDRYYKLIQSMAEAVSSLELVVQGKFQSIDALSERILQIFPELFSQEKGFGVAVASASAIENGNKPRIDSQTYRSEVRSPIQIHTCTIPRPSSSTNSDDLDSLPQKEQASQMQVTAEKNIWTKIPSKKRKTSRSPSSPAFVRENKSKVHEKTKETYDMNCNPPKPSQPQLSPSEASNAAHAEQKSNVLHHIVKPWPQPQAAPSAQNVSVGATPRGTNPQEQQAQAQITAAGQKLPLSSRRGRTPEGRTSPSPRNTRGLTGAVFPTAAHPINAANPQHNAFASARLGRPTVSMCPTNLRAQFQPISILKDSQYPSPMPMVKGTYSLRTQTRTILPEASLLQQQQAPPGPGPENKLGRARKNFRRDGTRRKPGPEDGEGASSADKPSVTSPRARAVIFTASTTSATVVSLPQVSQDKNSTPNLNLFKRKPQQLSKNSSRQAQAKLVVTSQQPADT